MGFITGNSSSDSSSTSHTESWLAAALEPMITGFVNDFDGIDYTDSVVSGLTPAEQKALERYGSGAAVDAGKAIAGKGGSLVVDSISSLEGLIHGGAKNQFMAGVTGIYDAADGFMENQFSAIQDSVYSDMGNTFGQTAQNNMASTAVSGSSAAQSATNAVLAGGANSMVQQESELAGKVLSGAIGITSGAMHSEISLLESMMREGGSIFGTGVDIAGKGASNQFKAGLFEQWFNQQVSDNNRRNEMINNNMDILDMGVLLDLVLPTAGLDTTTNNTSHTDGSGGGLW